MCYNNCLNYSFVCVLCVVCGCILKEMNIPASHIGVESDVHIQVRVTYMYAK